MSAEQSNFDQFIEWTSDNPILQGCFEGLDKSSGSVITSTEQTEALNTGDPIAIGQADQGFNWDAMGLDLSLVNFHGELGQSPNFSDDWLDEHFTDIQPTAAVSHIGGINTRLVDTEQKQNLTLSQLPPKYPPLEQSTLTFVFAARPSTQANVFSVEQLSPYLQAQVHHPSRGPGDAVEFSTVEASQGSSEFPSAALNFLPHLAFSADSVRPLVRQPSSSSLAASDAAGNSNQRFDYFEIPRGDDQPCNRYVVEPAHDERYIQDFTSFMPNQAWLSEDNLPPALGMLEPIHKQGVPRSERLDRTAATGYIIRTKFNRILPPIISWKVEPWRVLYWKSIEPSIQNDDIIDRMPWKTYTDVDSPGCPYSHRTIIRQTIVERERKWRLKAGGLSRLNSNKDRVSKDEIQIVERLIQNCDLSDPNRVFRTCQHNVVWEIDWTDMTMRQPRPKFSRNEKGKSNNYLGRKFPLPPPKDVISERVIKIFNQINWLAKEHPNLKASDALPIVNHRNNNHEKRRATIEAKQETGRTHRPPRPRKIKKPKGRALKSSNAPSTAIVLAQQLGKRLKTPNDISGTQLEHNAAVAPGLSMASLLEAGLNSSRKRKIEDNEQMVRVDAVR